MSNADKKYYYFPKLKPAIRAKGWNMNQFKSEAYKVSTTPSAGSWGKSMSASTGITETYIVRGKKVLVTLGFSNGVCDYEQV